MTAAERLKKAIRPLGVEARLALAGRAGADGTKVHLAWKGYPINAEDYLRICAALGVDPKNGASCAARRLSGLDWSRLGRDLRATRERNAHTVREAEPVIGLCKATISRIENGGNPKSPISKRQSIETVLKVCAYIGRHPNDYCKLSNVKHAVKHVDRVAEMAGP